MSEDQNARWVHHQQVDAISNLQRVPYLLRKQAGVLMPLRQSDPSLSLSDVANQWAMQRQLVEKQETAARRRIVNTENSVVTVNRAIDAANERIDYVLRKTLNEVQPRSPSEWWDWWTDYRECKWLVPARRRPFSAVRPDRPPSDPHRSPMEASGWPPTPQIHAANFPQSPSLRGHYRWYFQFRRFPSESHSTVVTRRRARVASCLASSIHSMYSRW